VRSAPRHAGGCHFYIHVVEAAYPERAVPCAERLPSLMPGAGHVVHMPAHVYIRSGATADAIERNVHALHADEPHIAEMPADGVYRLALHPHNAHFLSFAASMIGRSAQALDAARADARQDRHRMLRAPGLGALQHYYMMPLLANVRFGRWDAVLAEPEPAEDSAVSPRPAALRARAGAHRERRPRRRRIGARVAAPAACRRALKAVTIWDLNTGSSLLDIAQASVEGSWPRQRSDWHHGHRRDAARGRDERRAHLRRAAALVSVPATAARRRAPARGTTGGGRDGVPRGSRAPPGERLVARRLAASLRARGKLAEAARVDAASGAHGRRPIVPPPEMSARNGQRCADALGRCGDRLVVRLPWLIPSYTACITSALPSRKRHRSAPLERHSTSITASGASATRPKKSASIPRRDCSTGTPSPRPVDASPQSASRASRPVSCSEPTVSEPHPVLAKNSPASCWNSSS
jgi:hypothetical protein